MLETPWRPEEKQPTVRARLLLDSLSGQIEEPIHQTQQARTQHPAPSTTLLRRATHRISRRLQLILFRRLRAHQVTHEIVPPPPHHVRLIAETVVAVGQQQQVEI